MVSRHQANSTPRPEPRPRDVVPSGAAPRFPRPSATPVPGTVADRAPAPSAMRRDASAEDVWTILATVPDPEVPAVTLTELGMVRDVRREGDGWVVDVTPTYSGCPATAVIEMMVGDALRAAGVKASVNRVLSPAWTTDWITPEGHAKLEAYGIAPPNPKGPQRCPHCGAREVERVSQYGSTPCKAQWRCLVCREPFDYFKCH